MKNVTSSHVLPFRALIDACWKEKYTSSRFVRDLIAGITVGIIAIPLAMALAIGSGVAPQYGLYTSAVAGIVIALTGGSRFSVSGPTAAFVVILYPVSQQFGLAGLLVATLMSGIFLILFGLARFGRLIEYIPLSVTLGFTSGIGITIGTMQIKDFLGLQMAHVPERYLQKVGALFMALPTANFGRCGHWHRYTRHTYRLASLRHSSPGASARSAAGLRGDGRRQPARWTGRHHWLPVPLCSGGRLTGQRHSAAAAAAGSALGHAGFQLYPELGFPSRSAARRILHGNAGRDRIPALRRRARRHDRH